MTSDLARGWAWATLSDLGVEIRGQLKPGPGTIYDLYSVPTFSTGRPERIDGAQVKSGKRGVQPNDVLLCKINPRINRVWVVGETEGHPQIASTEYLVLRPHDPRMSSFIQQYLSSPRFRDWIKLSVEGATGSHTRAKSTPILQQLVPVAPLAEQERIVAAIEEHFSCLDAAESDLKAANAKNALLPSMVALHLFSSSWPTRRLGELARVGSGATPKRSEMRYWAGGTIPWVTSGAVNDRSIMSASELITEEALTETSVKLWPAGTVLVAMYGEGKTRGKAAVLEIESTCNQACAAIHYDRSLLDGKYLMAYLNSRYEANRSLSSGGVQPNLSLGVIKSMEIPIPSLTTQRTVALQAQDIAQQSDLLTEACTVAGKRITVLRRSILATAFSGQLVPQDPSDEPVSVLLERIAALRSVKPTRPTARA